MSLLGDSSDKKIEVKPTAFEQFERVAERVDKGWSITPADAKMLLELVRIYQGQGYYEDTTERKSHASQPASGGAGAEGTADKGTGA